MGTIREVLLYARAYWVNYPTWLMNSEFRDVGHPKTSYKFESCTFAL